MNSSSQLEESSRTSVGSWPLSAARYPQLLLAIQVLLLVSALLLLWPTTQSLMTVWEDADGRTYTHGYAILAICLWLLWRDRDRLAEVTVRPNAVAAILLVAASVVWLICVRAGIQTLHQILLPIMIWLAVCAALGPGVAMRSAFAIGYLFFAMPLWDAVNSLLQHLTVKVTDLALSATGVTAYVTGSIVHLPTGVFEIAGGCSGLHFLIVALAVAALYGEINRDTWRVRSQLLVLAAAFALLTNWLRVYIIILAGYLTDMQHYLVRVEHYRFGWVLFAVTMLGFFLIARRLPLAAQENRPCANTSGSVKVSSAMAAGVAMAVAATAVGPLWRAVQPIGTAQLPPTGAALIANPGPWSGPVAVSDKSWSPQFKGADVTQLGEYSRGQQRVQAFTALYALQEQGKELIGYGNTILGTEPATVTAESNMRIEGIAVTELLLERSGEPWVLWYFYQVDSLRTNREVAAQVWYGMSSLIKAPASRVVAVRAPCIPDCDTARMDLESLLSPMSL